MRRLNNLFTFIMAITAFFFGSFITKILSPADQCPAHTIGRIQLEPHPNVFLVVLVLSPPRNADQRNAMRSTWLRTARQPLHQQYYPEELIFLPTYSSNGHLQVELVDKRFLSLCGIKLFTPVCKRPFFQFLVWLFESFGVQNAWNVLPLRGSV